MRRRELFQSAAAALFARPMIARAASMPVIGFLATGSAASYAPFVIAFRQGLGDTGYEEGKTVAIEFRWAANRFDRLPALAADLVDRSVNVIATSGGTP